MHLHSVFLWPTLAAARAATRAGVPYVLSPRGMLVPELIRRRGRLRKLAWIHLVERRTLAGAAALHVTSDLEAAELARLGLRMPAVFAVPNGVDCEPPWEEAALSPAVRELVSGPPFLLFLGRLSWKKGLDRLILALPNAPDAILAVAGNDEERYRPQLEQLAAKASVAERVRFLGPVDGADRAALLQRTVALVLPSYSENFGNVVLEAMAAGSPVVVTPEVGVADMVREEKAGVVTEGDAPRLGAALHDLIARPEVAAEMGRLGAAAAHRRYSWKTIAAEMERVYDRVSH